VSPTTESDRTKMVVRNDNFSKLQASYLFRLVAEKKAAFVKENPDAKVISLGVGDTTQPLPEFIGDAMVKAAEGLKTKEGYSGYPDWNGRQDLREMIANEFYQNRVSADEIMISDGSKPDLARLQLLFDENVNIAVQDPVYPAYVDGSVISGKTGLAEPGGRYGKIAYLPCTPANDFFPDLSVLEKGKSYVIFFCSPNNPTGTVATRAQLEKLVAYAKESKSLIIFDSAYRGFIKDDSLPKSIYEIPGGDEVALESASFSKLVGFTGVRLGWTVCPKKVMYEDGISSVHEDWKRIMGTYFNGPSNIAEAGGVACMTPQGMKEMDMLIDYYMENAKTLRDVLVNKGKLEVYGGVHSPYLWTKAPNGQGSWDMWEAILKQCAIVTTPGVGFGQEGEGFVRFSCFCSHENVKICAERLSNFFESNKIAGA